MGAHIHTQTHCCVFQYNLIEHHLPGTFTWPGDSDTPVKREAHAFSQVLLRGVAGGGGLCVNIAEMVPLTLGQGVNTQDTSCISMYPADGMAAQPGRVGVESTLGRARDPRAASRPQLRGGPASLPGSRGAMLCR